MMPNCQEFTIDFGFHHIHQIFKKLFAKNMKGGSDKSEILCVGQLACAKKKLEKNIFVRGPLHGANIGQIFSSPFSSENMF